jgi:pimeloyl-ACP methyl ester carboxylesterase
MAHTVVLIHGMFVNCRSWEGWQARLEASGIACAAPAWPYHEGDPAELRRSHPPRLGELSLQSVTQALEIVVARYEQPILIGHSLGGLVVQRLIAQRRGSMGVMLCSVAPNAMMALDWGFLRTAVEIANPLRGDDIFTLDVETFHERFANTMTRAEADAAYARYIMPESRNVLRDALAEPGRVDVDRPHPPLLFIAAAEDRAIPPELVRKNAAAYSDPGSIVACHEFPGRSHVIQAERGWEEVADFVTGWIAAQGAAQSSP